MTGTPRNELNKIRNEMERDNKELSQDDVEPSASLLRGGRLVAEVDEAALTFYERVKGMIWYLLYLLYSASFGMKNVVSNHPKREIHERIETNESNKFSSSGENKSEEEGASKGLESRENNTNSSSSNDKTKSGEYVLHRPPKKPGGGEVYENNTATTIPCGTASEQENSRKTITDILEKKEAPDIVQLEKKTYLHKKGTLPWSDYSGGHRMVTSNKDGMKNQVTTTAEKEDDADSTATVTTAAVTSVCESGWGDDSTEVLAETTTLNDQISTKLAECQHYNFMTGKEIRDRSRRVVLDAYVKARTTTDQIYQPRTRRVVKAAKIWKGTKQKENDNTEFTFTLKSANPPDGATNNNLFVFGKNTNTTEPATNPTPKKQGRQERKPKDWERTNTNKKLLNKEVGRKGSHHMGNTAEERRRTCSTQRKINPYVRRNQELKTEENKRTKRKVINWKRRQQQKLEQNTEVLDVSEFLRKKSMKKTRNKMKRINAQEQIPDNVVKKYIGTTYTSEMEEWCIFCLEKRQQSSSAVMFARFRSNKRYKPGD